ncbi:hypothetical protein FHW23_002677 [Curtobacterium pusillum]|uniref:Uncharacterized protein n=1 Tax=Curtobacterium pusillum TaxID=69373 RepID=A0AAW3T8J0_9MICO|nr:enterotoxin A family protein [Curtobacterium pusillum]MBA8991408.1 hypothetical protein [Curtobacterium pusillum]
MTLNITRPRHRGWTLAALVATTLVATLLVPAPAHAIDDDAFPTVEDIQELRGEIGEIAVPEWVYRVDTRTPQEIQAAGGFLGQGGNYNLADHQTGMSLKPDVPDKSGWVSTSSSREEAFSFGNANFGDRDTYYLYEIKPGDQFTSVQESIAHAMEADRENAVAWYGEGRGNGYEAWENLKLEKEWAGRERVSFENVSSWSKVEKVDGYFPSEPPKIVERNTGYRAPAGEPTTDPYPIDEITLCDVRAVCDFRAPADEDALAELHGDRFSGDFDDFDFEVSLGKLTEEEGAILAPLPETIAHLDEFRGGGKGLDGFNELGAGLDDAFAADTRALEAVSSDLEVLASVGKAAGKAVEVGSELLPYLGIAASGYALKGDIEDGRWGDAAADAIAEALQVAMLAQPEFTPILEVALMADLVVQAIGDAVWGWLHPKPAISPEHRDEISKSLDASDAAFTNVRDLWEKERRSALDEYYPKHVANEQAELVAQKLHSDLAVITASYRAANEALQRHARLAMLKAQNAEQAGWVASRYIEHDGNLRRAAAGAVTRRTDQYELRALPFLVASAQKTYRADMKDLRERYFAEVADKYLADVNDVVFRVFWDARPGDPWDRDLSAAEVKWTKDYLGRPQNTVEHTLATIDLNRPRSAPEIVDEKLVADFRKSLRDSTAGDRVLPPALLPPTVPAVPDPEPGPDFRPSASIDGRIGDLRYTLSGTGPAGWTVTGFEGSTTVGKDGKWSIPVTGDWIMSLVKWTEPGAPRHTHSKVVSVGCGTSIPLDDPNCDPYHMDPFRSDE